MKTKQELDQAFTTALLSVIELEPWIPEVETHVLISDMCDTIRSLRNKAMAKHFPELHPMFDKTLKSFANPGGK